jgi:hypothetical protein
VCDLSGQGNRETGFDHSVAYREAADIVRNRK